MRYNQHSYKGFNRQVSALAILSRSAFARCLRALAFLSLCHLQRLACAGVLSCSAFHCGEFQPHTVGDHFGDDPRSRPLPARKILQFLSQVSRKSSREGCRFGFGGHSIRLSRIWCVAQMQYYIDSSTQVLLSTRGVPLISPPKCRFSLSIIHCQNSQALS